MTTFSDERAQRIAANGADQGLMSIAHDLMKASIAMKYSYNFSWLSRPIIQYPQDIVAMQEIIWQVRPDLIVETGVAHGGSLILSASLLALLDYSEAVETGTELNPVESRRRVVGVDIDVRPHNRAAIHKHPFAHLIDLIEGSSVDPNTIAKVRDMAVRYKTVLMCLDSNHTHDHVLAELEAYAPLTSRGSYCVVFDTVIEDMPEDTYPDRPWGPGNSPKTAVQEYLRRLETDGRSGADGSPLKFEMDVDVPNKLLLTVASGGYLRRL